MNLPRMTQWIVWAFVLVLGLNACSKQENPAPGAGAMTVRIGSVSPLTGPQAHLGHDNANGARLAIDEINAAGVTLGGRKVKFWELISVTRGERSVVIRAAGIKPEWAVFGEWAATYEDIIAKQDRSKLDLDLDADFVRAALIAARLRFYLSIKSGYPALYKERTDPEDSMMLALEAFDLYGGQAMEQAVEYGSYRI